MTAPTPLPKYIFKILPATPLPPTPLPHALPLSALDASDGFIHLSTSFQILRTLNAFFSSSSRVYILRIKYDTVAQYIKWEDTKGVEAAGSWDVEGQKGFFPHIYGNGEDGVGGGLKMGRQEVESVEAWDRGEGSWTGEGWPFGEDVPV